MTGNTVSNVRALGFDPDRLARVKKAMEEDTSRGMYDGAVFVIGRHGQLAMHEAVGHSDLAKKRPARLDDVFNVFSVTKGFTGMAVLCFVEKGKLALTTKVAEVIPEFGVKGKQRVTVGQLLIHSGGMPSGLPMGLPLQHLGNLQAFVAAVCNEPLANQPGVRISYSPIGAYAVLGEVVRRVDGGRRPFRQILAEEFFQPLGMKDTSLGLRKDLAARKVPVVVRDTSPGIFEPAMLEGLGNSLTEETEIPAGGAVSTGWDMFRWGEMLRRGGELNGARVLSPAAIKLAATNQTGSEPNHIFDVLREMRGWDPWPAYVGLGLFLRGEGIFPTPFGTLASPRTFGCLGAGGNMCMIDPERDLVFVLITAGLLEESAFFLRHQRLADMVLASVVD